MKTFLITLCLLVSFTNLANETYQFDSPEQERLYREIANELRCPKCQNQSIADSDAPLSEDLRYLVYQKLKAGENKQQILQYMQDRYGDFVLYDPPISPKNYVLWFMPLLVFIIIIIALIARVGRRELQPEDEAEE
ncbi:cytochrome c-type biogenesis protein [Kangiella sp. HZ709]|uniref:cytochrome c-type biogenesis protein n=1 Tax=Kangiella sp. HZ709 TaxID=2666328 RepID=UPI0012AF16B9|nr:cytochrome c-type biogenesis protein [Kangiella sp. HZ709]MRX26568.1 heme lyase NrfEFG subunit NrfF [Kangiella sp. HZ709]